MNNILKLLIPFLVVLGLHADQGMLSTITPTGENGTGDVDVFYDGVNIYGATSNGLYKYDTNMTLLNSNASISSGIKKVIANSTNVYFIQNTQVHQADTSLSAISMSKDTTKTLNCIALSEDGSYLFAGSSTGILVIQTSDLSIKAFIESTNSKDLKVKDDLLYVADDWGGLKVIDISNPEFASVLSTSTGEFYKLSLENKALYTVGKTGLSSFDISSPSAPVYKGTTNTTASDLTSLIVQDTHAFIAQHNANSNEFGVYDVSKKANMQAIANSPFNDYFINAITGANAKIYVATSGGIVVFNAQSDYDNTAQGASQNQITAKTVEQLNENNGIFGNLQDQNDVDFIKINLQGGRLDAYISGLDDINVTLYDSNDTTRQPIASVESSLSSTPKLLHLNTETASGTHYLKIQNTDSTTSGEYKIIADFSVDDWPDFKDSAQLINYTELIKGNMLRGDDSDYFRIDLASKGGVIVYSQESDIIDFELINASSGALMLDDNASLNTGRTYKAVDNGIYYLKVKAASLDVENQDYSFKVDFSKDLVLDKEDDASFALKKIADVDRIQNFDQIQIVGENVYMVNTTTNTLMRSQKSSINTPIASYVSSSGTIVEYQVIGDYTYVLTDTRLHVLYTSSLNNRSEYVPNSQSNGFKINGDKLYLRANSSNVIEVVNISNKDSLTKISDLNVGETVNDFDLKGSFSQSSSDASIYALDTYLYVATNNGLKRFNVKEVSNAVELSNYKAGNSFSKIKISNPYAYVESNVGDGFSILYIKRPSSTPKLKGSLNWGNGVMKSMVVHQDNAYILNNENILSVVDISDQTAPKKVDIPYLRANALSIGNGIGYFLQEGTLDSEIYNIVQSYDMSNDYADVKGGALEVKYDATNYGLISQHRNNESDVFYINAQRSMDFNLSAEGSISTTYKLYHFNSDLLVSSFASSGVFNASTTQSNTHVKLKAGEYYLRVNSTSTTSGSYAFNLTKNEDDFSDSFLYADSIVMGESQKGNILVKEDKDVVKIKLNERGSFDFNASKGIKVTLLYDDTLTTLSDNTNTIHTVLNPGTYFIVMESNSTFTGDYSFQSHFESSGELAMPDGFDGIENFGASVSIYGERYIYTIDEFDNLSIYNHLLQRVQKSIIDDGSHGFAKQSCSKAFFYEDTIFINSYHYEDGEIVCSSYKSIDLQNQDGEFHTDRGIGNKQYTNEGFNLTFDDINVVAADNGYLYEYSKAEKKLVKTTFGDAHKDAFSDYTYSTPQAIFGPISDLQSIKGVKNDALVDIIAIDSQVSIYKTDPNYRVQTGTDPEGNPLYQTKPSIVSTKSFPALTTKVKDMHIDTNDKKVYILSENASEVFILSYNKGDISLSSISSVDLGVQATGMFIKGEKIYMTIEDPMYHGVKVYDYPLTSPAVATHEAQNIGANLSSPFTWDGTTFNYLSNLSPQVYYLSESFVDGQTTGTYSVAQANDIKEGEGGFEGCFIATAAYGSYFEPHVKVLRNFRDKVLLSHKYGQKIVDFYYKHSPSIASKIAMHSGAKNIIRQVLTPIVFMVKYPLSVLALLIALVFGVWYRGYVVNKKGVLV